MSTTPPTLRLVTLTQIQWTVYFVSIGTLTVPKYDPNNLFFRIEGIQYPNFYSLQLLTQSTPTQTWQEVASGPMALDGVALVGNFKEAEVAGKTWRVCVKGQNVCSGQLGISGPAPDRYHWDGSACVVDPNGEYSTLAGCQLDHPTTTPQPPPITQPPVPAFPTPPSSLNPIDWIKWIGDVIKWLVGALGGVIYEALKPLITGLWALLPDPIKKLITGLSDLASGLGLLLTDPAEFVAKIVRSLISEKSPSLTSELTDALAKNLDQRWRVSAFEIPDPIRNIVNDIINAIVNKHLPKFTEIIEDTASTPIELVAKLADLRSKIAGDTLSTAFWNEVMTLGQVEALTGMVNVVDDIIGISRAQTLFQEEYVRANIAERTRQTANALFKLGIPPFAELTAARRLELLTQEDYANLVAREAGIPSDLAEILYRSSLGPPALEDYIRYNLRFPAKAKKLKDIEAIVNIDAERFGDIFAERFYLDPSITEARFMYETGQASEDEVLDIVRRNRYRTTPRAGETKSDADRISGYLTSFQTRIWYRQELLALRAKYVAGQATESDLETAAKKLLVNEKAVGSFISAAKIRKELKDLKPEEQPRAFPLALLVELGAGDYVDETDIDRHLGYYGYEDEDTATLKDYVTDKIAEKKSKLPSAV